MEVEISRRKFLQGSVAMTVVGAGVATTSGLIASHGEHKSSSAPGMPSSITTKTGKGKAKEVPTLCEICVNKCAAIARVEDGIVTKLDPNPLFPKSRNMLCARGNAGIQQLYDPDRLKYPLIRIGKRGEGKFKRVSWEEAYDAILNGTEHFKGLKDILEEEKNNRSTIGYCAGEGMAEHTFQNWMKCKFGSFNFVNHGTICLTTTIGGYTLTIGSYASVDFENAEYVIMAGANRAEAIVTPDTMDIFKRTKGRGAKLVCVDPRFTNTAAKADTWVPIKVGTDLAFVLALTYVALTEELYNKEFVANNVNGFDEYKNHIISKKYTPEWAEKITGIKADTIRKIAREFMAAAPKAIYYQGRRSTFSQQDFQLRRAQAIFSALGGGIDTKGGIIFGKKLPLGKHGTNIPVYSTTKDRVDYKKAAIVGSTGTWIGFREAVLEGKPYPVRGMFIYKHNPMLNLPNINKTRKMFEKLDLVVAIDIMPSDTVMMSDVILPECTYLEREDPVKTYGGTTPSIALRQKVIDPMYETKPVYEIMKGLAEKVTMPLWEIAKKYDKDIQKAIDGMTPEQEKEFMNKNGHNLADWLHLPSQEHVNEHQVVSKWGEEAWKTLREKGVFYPKMDKYFKQVGANNYQYYPEDKKYYSTKKGKFPTPSGKIEFVLPNMASKGLDAMPTWRDELYVKTPKGKFKFITGRHAQFTQNNTQNNAILLDIIPENYLWINSRVAKEKGIKLGDLVEVSSKIGKVQIKAYPTEKIAPDNLFFVHGFGASSKELTLAHNNGAADNMIIEDIIEPYFGAAAMHATIVDVRKV
jgi:thiosulfate reductase/polysulfide reductase chain A